MCIRMAPDTADLSVLLSVEWKKYMPPYSAEICSIYGRQALQLSVSCSVISDLPLLSSVSNSPSSFPLSWKLTQVVPNVHLAAQSPDFDDGLTQEVVTLTFKPLFHAWLDVVILVPHAYLDAVWWVVAFTGWGRIVKYCEYWWSKNIKIGFSN